MKPQLKTRDTEAQWSFLTSEHWCAAMAMCLDSTKKGCRSSAFPPKPHRIFHVSSFGWSSFESFIMKLIIRTSLVAQMVKASTYNAGDPGSIPGAGRSPGEGNGNPLQYSCLENPTHWGAWWATVHGVTDSDMTERLHLNFTHTPPLVCWEFLNLYTSRILVCSFSYPIQSFSVFGIKIMLASEFGVWKCSLLFSLLWNHLRRIHVNCFHVW